MAKAKKVKDEPLIRVDTSDLKLLLLDMENFVQGPGTVADRQALVDKLKEIIAKMDG